MPATIENNTLIIRLENILAIIHSALPDLKKRYPSPPFWGRGVPRASSSYHYSEKNGIHVTVDSPAKDVIQVDLDGGTLPEGLKSALMGLSPNARYDSYSEDAEINRIIRIPLNPA